MKSGPRPSETTLAAPVEATLDLAPGLQSAPSHERIVATRRPPRDYFLRRALAAADLAAVLVAGAVAMVLDPTAYASQAMLWFVVMLPVWLVLFRLYGLYERDVKRVSISALDDLPALFHAFVIGTLLIWITLKLGSGHGLTVAEAITFGLSGSGACVDAARRPPGARCFGSAAPAGCCWSATRRPPRLSFAS